MFTKDQQYAYDEMVLGKNVFITGSAGTGKSYLLNAYYEYAINKYSKNEVFKTSSTGISAVLISGKTLHSWAGINLGLGTVNELIMKIKPKIKTRWKKTKVLFIDEISMINPDLFDKLEEIARKLRLNSKPFGGIQIIITGDFFQLPVVKCKNFCFEANKWNIIDKTIQLKTIVRQSDIIFQNILNRIRIGEIDENDMSILEKRINIDLKNDYGILPTILYAKNVDVDFINNKKLNELNEKKYEYEAEYTILKNETKYNIIDFLKETEKSIPNKIILCVGAQVVFKKNISTDLGIANGTRGIIVDFQQDEKRMFPIVQILSGEIIHAIPQEFEYQDNEYHVIKKHIPLKLAWATTIHGAQGMTLDLVMADLGNNIFEYGQVYVALSRVKDINGLSLKSFEPSSIIANPKVIEYYNSLE